MALTKIQAAVLTLLGVLIGVAAAAWQWGPPGLAVGGAFIAVIGAFLINVDDRRP